MSRRILVLLFCLFCFGLAANSQPLSAYVNIQNQIMVWDNGMIRKIDYLAPTAMKIGRVAIPYLDNSRSFKIYYGGGTKVINAGFTNNFFVSDDLVTFLNAQSLNVFDNGVVKNLTKLVGPYYIGDSLIVYYEGVRNEYKAYYNGNIYPIENFLAGDALQVVKVSDNIAAYDNYANQFRIFYHGQIIPQEDFAVSSFDVGRNTVAYVDVNKQFKVFHDGKTTMIESFPPQSFTAGDDLVAYVSSDGYFKIFYNDSVMNLGFFKPDYQVGDNVVAFQDGSGYFKAFYKGDIITLETYYPDHYTVQYNSIAYVNTSNMLRMFSNGEVYDVTSIYDGSDANTSNSWKLSYDVLQYQVGLNIFKIFYQGKEY